MRKLELKMQNTRKAGVGPRDAVGQGYRKESEFKSNLERKHFLAFSRGINGLASTIS